MESVIYISKIIKNESNLINIGNGCSEGLECQLFVMNCFAKCDTFYDLIEFLFNMVIREGSHSSSVVVVS
jgi:hypothetical protein